MCLAQLRGFQRTIAQGWANIRFLSVPVSIMHESTLKKKTKIKTKIKIKEKNEKN
jgi:hypothetical protein